MTKHSRSKQAPAVAVPPASLLPPPVLRRRSWLKSTCAAKALLALPAALSLGITLAPPAHASPVTTITDNKSSTVILSNSANYKVPLTLSAYRTISTSGIGVSGDDSKLWDFHNFGTVISNDSYAVDIVGGAIWDKYRASTISVMYGAIGGVLISGTTQAFVTNGAHGTITGGTFGVELVSPEAFLANSGIIRGNNTSNSTGAYLENGGYAINHSRSTISGFLYGLEIKNGAGTVTNNGSINSQGDGILLGSKAGTLINNGKISQTGSNSSDAAVKMFGGYLENFGTSFYSPPVEFISGYANGVITYGTVTTIQNKGTLRGTGTFGNGADGIILGAGGTITNHSGTRATAIIYGAGDAIDVTNGGTVFNQSGTIKGRHDGITMAAGGYVSNAATTTIYGGNFGIHTSGTLATVVNSGTITGHTIAGVDLQAGGFVGNAFAGTISGGNFGIFTAGTPGTVANSGSITGHTIAGVDLQAGGFVSNTGFITGGTYGVDVQNALGTVINTGSITGTTLAGVWLNAGGFVSNAVNGTIFGGWDAVAITDAAGTVVNAGQIAGPGNLGVYLGDGGAVTNAAGGLITSNKGGIQIQGALGYALNQGTIAAVKWDGVHLVNGGSVVNAGPGASITGMEAGVLIGYAHDTAANYGQVTNSGYIGGGTAGVALFGTLAGLGSGLVVNSGTIVATLVPGAGVYLYHGGTVTNASGGVINGAVGVGARFGFARVDNAGSITGAAYGVELAAGGYVSNASSASIYGHVDGVYITSTPGTVINAGSITGKNSIGVALFGGGYVSNAITGTITGGKIGVEIQNATGKVINRHSITGSTYGVALQAGGYVNNDNSLAVVSGGDTGVTISGTLGTVLNAGTITGHAIYGIDLQAGGFINNNTFAMVYGGDMGVTVSGTPGTVFNAGFITGETLTGVDLSAGGLVSNSSSGHIAGYHTGVQISGTTGYLFNAGTIIASGTTSGAFSGLAGLRMGDGGTVSNTSAGLISGADYGIFLEGAVGTVLNAGTITGSQNSGVILKAGGYLNNAESASIYGHFQAVYVINAAGTIVNSGSITGNGIGIWLIQGGNVTNNTSGVVTGQDHGIYAVNAAGTIFNSGSISGNSQAIWLKHGGFVSNASTGIISSSQRGIYIANAAGTIINAGTIDGKSDQGIWLRDSGYVNNISSLSTIYGASRGVYFGQNNGFGTLFNAGTIIGKNQYGVFLGDGGYLSNASSGTIYGGDRGVMVSGQAGTVLNAGTITGNGEAGVWLYDGGAVDNGGSIYGSDQGVWALSGNATVVNSGSITGHSGSGVWLQGGGTLDNISTLASIYGSEKGVWIQSGAATVSNAGQIKGGTQYGVWMQDGGRLDNASAGTITGPNFGVWIQGGAGTVLNAGTVIAGGTNGVGVYLQDGGSLLNSGHIVSTLGTGARLEDSAYLTNSSGGTITGYTIGAALYGTFSSVINGGKIDATNSAGIGVFISDLGLVGNSFTGVIQGGSLGAGVYLQNGGSAINAGEITGGFGVKIANTFGVVGNFGSIGGDTYGVALLEGGAVINPVIAVSGSSYVGVISGGTTGVYLGGGTIGFVFNEGTITGRGTMFGDYGVELNNGGTVFNLLATHFGTLFAGSIYGEIGVGVNNTFGSVLNAGSIGGEYVGARLNNGGIIENITYGNGTGVISGGYIGVQAFSTLGNTITNSGVITGTGGVGVELAYGTLNNEAGGVIRGGHYGVTANDATITNAGLIADSPLTNHAGVLIFGTSSLANLATGTISGETGVIIAGDSDTLFNAGTIIGTGGDAVTIVPNLDPVQITLTTGSTLFGAIDGGGTDGQITLTGSNIMDSNIVNFGTGSALSIVPGADWTASGNWTIASVTNSGTFQPGIIGTPLNFTGNFVQGSLGTLRVVVAPSVTSQFNVTGTAALAGKLTYVFAPGFYHSGVFEFLNATGGVTGGFDSITYNGDVPPGLTHSTSSEISSANLVLTGTEYVAPEDNSLFSDLNEEAAMQAQAANDSLLGKAGEGGASNPEACAAAEGVNQAGNAPGSTASQMATALGNAFCSAGGWIQATGEAASMGGAVSFNAAGGGFLAGIDKPVGSSGTRVGLAVGYDTTWLHDSAGGKGSMDTTRAGLYGSQPIGSFTLAADFLYGYASNTTTRQTGIGGLGAKYSGNIYSGGVQISTGMAMNGFNIEPSAGVRAASVNTDSLNETASGVAALFAVKGASTSYTSIQPFVNVGISRSFLTGSAITVTPEASVGYTLEAGDRGKAVSLTIADGTTYLSGHSNPDSSAAQISAGIAAGKGNWSLYARYSAYVSGNWTAQTGEAGLQVRF